MANKPCTLLIVLLASSFQVTTSELNKLTDFWAVENSNAVFKWNTESEVNEIEWFFPTVSDTTLMLFEKDTGLRKNSLYNVDYVKDVGNAAMSLLAVTTDNSSTYAVKVTTSANNVEEETTKLTVITMEEFLRSISVEINGKPYDPWNNTIEPKDLVIEMKVQQTYGKSVKTCTHLSEDKQNKSVLTCEDDSCNFNVVGVEPKDIIINTLSYDSLQGPPSWEFRVSGSSTPTSLPPKGSSTPTSLPPKGSSSLATPKGFGIILCFFAYLSC